MKNLKKNIVTLKVGDIFRLNGAKKHNTVVNEFEYNGETFIVYIGDTPYSKFEIREKENLCSVTDYYGNVFSGIVEVNGMKVRGTGGKLLDNPVPAPVKEKKAPKPIIVEPDIEPIRTLTDFERFVKVQRSGVINMTDIVTGSRLAGISEEKYEDIMWHYDEYKKGIRK